MSPSVPPTRTTRCGCLAAMALGGLLALSAQAQNFSRGVAEVDRFFDNGVLPEDLALLMDPTLGGTLKGEFGYALSVGMVYDTNVNLSPTDEQEEVFFSVNPSIFYTTDPEGGARHVITAYYSPNPQFYRESSEQGRFNQNGGVSYEFNGSRASVSAFANLREQAGSDRFTGGFAEGTLLGYGVRLAYQLAPRTSAYATLSQSRLRFDTSNQQGSDVTTATVGAFWSATERLRIGPAFRYQLSDSATTGESEAYAVLFRADYEATELLNFTASLGIEQVEYDLQGGDLDPRLTGNLRFSYVLNELWTLGGGVEYASIPSPSSRGFIVNDLSFSARLNRDLDIGSVGCFASYSLSDFDSVSASAGSRQDDEFYELGIRYGRPFISDRIGFGTSLSYLESQGSREWSKWLFSMSLSTSF